MNGVEGEHRLRPRSRMVASTPFRIGASQRSIAFAATSAAPAPYHGLGTAAFSTTASSAAALIETLGGLLQPPPAQHHGLGTLDRLRGDPRPAAALRSKCSRRPSLAQPEPNALLEMLGCFLKLLDDVDALRAHSFACAALDAIARAARRRLPAILLLGELGVLRLNLQV